MHEAAPQLCFLLHCMSHLSQVACMQVQLSIWPETDAEEKIMSMPATEALLDALGLHFGGGDDPSTWLLDGSVHELQDRLMSLLVCLDPCIRTTAVMSTKCR